MKKTYNIALIPTTKGKEVIRLAEKFSEISEQYQLGKNSLPHVTLCQFQAEEKEIKDIWERVYNSLSEHCLELEFKDFSCVTFDKSVFWASLMPNRRLALSGMHQIVTSIVGVPINKSFDPHMTLINSKESGYKEIVSEVAKTYVPISDLFTLSIGECDSVGQFTKLLHKSEGRNRLQCKL